MKKILTILSVMGLSLSHVLGQDDPENAVATPAKVRPGFWEANIKGGNYSVKLGHIISVSRHLYVLNGAAIVDEVTIDTAGQSLVRFYHVGPLEPAKDAKTLGHVVKRTTELTNKIAKRTDYNIHDMVMKQYPVTTHAGTVEFRLTSKESMAILYDSVKGAWQSGRARVFTER